MSHTTTNDCVSVESHASSHESAGFIAMVRKALAVRRQRRALLGLDHRMLADIGLSEADAYREAHRSLFDVDARGVRRR